MASRSAGRRGPVTQDEVAYLERRIRDRQESIRRYAALCRRDLRHGLTSPRLLLLASAGGFLAGMLTWRSPARVRVDHVGDQAGSRATTMLSSALTSIALIRPWIPLLRRLGAMLFAPQDATDREPESPVPSPP